MSIASELNALNGYILGAYDEINTKGGTVPTNKNMANLASAIGSISTGSSTTITPLNVTENGTYTAPTGTAYSPVTVNVSGGGGTQILGYEVKTGEFTFDADQSAAYTLITDVAYTSVSRTILFIYWWTPENINDYGYVPTKSQAYGVYIGGYMRGSSYRGTGSTLSVDSSTSGSPNYKNTSGFYTFSLPASSSRMFRTGAVYKWLWLYIPK